MAFLANSWSPKGPFRSDCWSYWLPASRGKASGKWLERWQVTVSFSPAGGQQRAEGLQPPPRAPSSASDRRAVPAESAHEKPRGGKWPPPERAGCTAPGRSEKRRPRQGRSSSCARFPAPGPGGGPPGHRRSRRSPRLSDSDHGLVLVAVAARLLLEAGGAQPRARLPRPRGAVRAAPRRHRLRADVLF